MRRARGAVAELADRHSLAAAALFVLALLLVVSTAVSAETPQTMRFPGGRVLIDLPPSFAPGAGGSVLDDGKDEHVFILQEYPSAAYDWLAGELTPERLAADGFHEVVLGEIERKDVHVLASGTRATGEEEHAIYMLLVSEGSFTYIVTSDVPLRRIEDGSVRRADIVRALATARRDESWRPALRLGSSGGFREAQYVGQTTVYTRNGRPDPADGPVTAAFIIQALPPAPEGGDLAELARQRFGIMSGVEDIVEDEGRSLEIGGLPAFELVGTARERGSDLPALVYQVLLRGPAGLYRLAGRGPDAEREALVEELRAIAGTLSIEP